MDTGAAIRTLDSCIDDASQGLPEDIFLFVTGITPMVNVDLLIRDDRGCTLLTWRDDGYCAAGWHVPGGIVRFKERMEDRIHAVAASELDTSVRFTPEPLAVNEVIHPSRGVRGHFVSFLFECILLGSPSPCLRLGQGAPKPGQWAWHKECPDNLVSVQDMYKEHFSPGTPRNAPGH